jgi:hypothetical protein
MAILKYTGAQVTKAGYQVRDIQFNSVGNCYIGKVYDAQAYGGPMWQSATWDKRGKCRNRTRPDCDLVQPTKQGA